MIITKTIKINDEPMKSNATGKRTAKLKYFGNKFVYAEVCNVTKKIQCMVHSAETSELNVAVERLTPDCNRSIVEINATESTILASILSDMYELEVDDYAEQLPDGSTFTYDYPKPNRLTDIFSVHEMIYNFETKDFDDYLYITNNTTSNEFKDSVNMVVDKTKDSLTNNIYDEDDIKKINNFLNELTVVLNKVDQGIDHWKLKFPVCEAPL